MPRGKLVALEGPEGAGKSSCWDYLQLRLDPRQFVFAREPGGTDLSEYIRGATKQEWGNKPSALEFMLLMTAARSHLVRTVIAPALEGGKHVITDRFFGSTFAYQVHAPHESDDRWREEMRRLTQIITNLTVGHHGAWPDRWLFLDVEPRVGKARALQAKGKTADHFDRAPLALHENVRKGFHTFFTGRKNVVVIDTTHIPLWTLRSRVLARVISP